MKHSHLIRRISAAALALLMLASLPACQDPATPPAESENDTTKPVTDTTADTRDADLEVFHGEGSFQIWVCRSLAFPSGEGGPSEGWWMRRADF